MSECGAGIAKPGSQAIIATVFGNYTVNVLTGLNDSNQVRHSLTLCCVCLLCTDLCECVCVCVAGLLLLEAVGNRIDHRADQLELLWSEGDVYGSHSLTPLLTHSLTRTLSHIIDQLTHLNSRLVPSTPTRYLATHSLSHCNR